MSADGSERYRIEGLRLERGGTTVLDRIDAVLPSGALVGIVGPNGAGKSSLLSALIGDLTATSGRILRDGQPLRPSRQVAYLPQARQQLSDVPISVHDVVHLGRQQLIGPWRGFAAEDHAAVEAALTAMDINDRRQRLFRDCSGGEQQRTVLARALATGADILLLDEPLAGLDEPSAEDLLHRLCGWCTPPRLVVAVIHDLAVVRRHCTHVLLLNRRQIAWGETAAVMTHANLDQCFLRSALMEPVAVCHAHDHLHAPKPPAESQP